MKLDRNKIFSFMPALVLALALAGCGGGGGGTAGGGDDDGMPMPTPQEMCEDAGNVWSDDACITPAEHAFNMCVAGGGQDNGDGTCTSAEDLAKVEADTKAAATKTTAIEAEAAQDAATAAAAGLGGTGATIGDADGNYQLSISRPRAGTTVSVTVHGATDDDDEMFMVNDLMDGRTMHTRTMEANADGDVVEEIVIVGTDIAAPEAVEFAKFEVIAADGTTTTPQALNARDLDDAVDADGDGTATNDFTALTVTTDAATLALVKSGSFAASTTRNMAFDDAGTEDVDEATEVAGTYNGASGTYRCNGAGACTVATNAMGVVSAITGDLVFTPAAGATSDQPDYDYTNYGFWLQKTTDADGAVTYNQVQTFAGSRLNASGGVGAVTGSAEYAGGAVGVYVHQTYKTDGTFDATSGHFSADVSLTAIFGQVNDDNGEGTIAPNMLNTLRGTISNFALSGEEENDWSVAVSGDITDTAGTASGTAKGGDGDGSFSATFHGSVTADADGNVPQPGSVVGEFNAGFTNGSAAGAFGAQKVME
ncbi:MAG: hypothetical protein OXQ29_24200 [Rhodospirillaceae bacterium]|nr:hypothetical protein [Rhodospirillaceae bacterium]